MRKLTPKIQNCTVWRQYHKNCLSLYECEQGVYCPTVHILSTTHMLNKTDTAQKLPSCYTHWNYKAQKAKKNIALFGKKNQNKKLPTVLFLLYIGKP